MTCKIVRRPYVRRHAAITCWRSRLRAPETYRNLIVRRGDENEFATHGAPYRLLGLRHRNRGQEVAGSAAGLPVSRASPAR